MISRFLDLADTTFFVLRKKNTQLTFLHVYHHTIVPFLCWMSLKYNATIPIIRLFMLFNTAIHTAMYAYYSLAALGPSVQPYLWWKRYLTKLQIIQFVVCGATVLRSTVCSETIRWPGFIWLWDRIRCFSICFTISTPNPTESVAKSRTALTVRTPKANTPSIYDLQLYFLLHIYPTGFDVITQHFYF